VIACLRIHAFGDFLSAGEYNLGPCIANSSLFHHQNVLLQAFSIAHWACVHDWIQVYQMLATVLMPRPYLVLNAVVTVPAKLTEILEGGNVDVPDLLWGHFVATVGI